jgi:hypothetical protein
MDLKNMLSEKNQMQKVTCAQNHLNEVSRIGKSIEKENSDWVGVVA